MLTNEYLFNRMIYAELESPTGSIKSPMMASKSVPEAALKHMSWRVTEVDDPNDICPYRQDLLRLTLMKAGHNRS